MGWTRNVPTHKDPRPTMSPEGNALILNIKRSGDFFVNL
jgi:hypothetical protein